MAENVPKFSAVYVPDSARRLGRRQGAQVGVRRKLPLLQAQRHRRARRPAQARARLHVGGPGAAEVRQRQLRAADRQHQVALRVGRQVAGERQAELARARVQLQHVEGVARAPVVEVVVRQGGGVGALLVARRRMVAAHVRGAERARRQRRRPHARVRRRRRAGRPDAHRDLLPIGPRLAGVGPRKARDFDSGVRKVEAGGGVVEGQLQYAPGARRQRGGNFDFQIPVYDPSGQGLDRVRDPPVLEGVVGERRAAVVHVTLEVAASRPGTVVVPVRRQRGGPMLRLRMRGPRGQDARRAQQQRGRRGSGASGEEPAQAPQGSERGARGPAAAGHGVSASRACGSARLGSARLGSARLGSARLGSARLGSARRTVTSAASARKRSQRPMTVEPFF